MKIVVIFLAVLTFGLATEGHGQDLPKSAAISWKALEPDSGLFFDPFTKLSPEQLQNLGYVIRVRWLIAEEKLSAEGKDAVKANNLALALKKEGVDIAWLMQQRERVRDIRDRQLQSHAASVAKRYQDQQVELTGFAVPIGSNSKTVTEFFLVPSVEFCKDSVPPSTQAVYVKTPKAIATNNRTTPVRVTGSLGQRTTLQSTGFPGIASSFEAEYVIEPTDIKVLDWQTSKQPGVPSTGTDSKTAEIRNSEKK